MARTEWSGPLIISAYGLYMRVSQLKLSTRQLWFIQLLEYVIGFALASVAAKTSTPLVPAIFATLVIANAASVKAPLSAFRLTNGRIHQMIGLAIAIGAVSAAVFIELDMSTRAMLIALAGAEGFVSVRFGHGI